MLSKSCIPRHRDEGQSSRNTDGPLAAAKILLRRFFFFFAILFVTCPVGVVV